MAYQGLSGKIMAYQGLSGNSNSNFAFAMIIRAKMILLRLLTVVTKTIRYLLFSLVIDFLIKIFTYFKGNSIL